MALLKEGSWMAKLDLSNYFLKIPWSEEWSKKYAWFKDFRRDRGLWQGKGPPPEGWPDEEEKY